MKKVIVNRLTVIIVTYRSSKLLKNNFTRNIKTIHCSTFKNR